LAYELAQADQKFLIGDEFLLSTAEQSNSWVKPGRLKTFPFQIFSKDAAYILCNLKLNDTPIN
jgi:hypothetical protein